MARRGCGYRNLERCSERRFDPTHPMSADIETEPVQKVLSTPCDQPVTEYADNRGVRRRGHSSVQVFGSYFAPTATLGRGTVAAKDSQDDRSERADRSPEHRSAKHGEHSGARSPRCEVCVGLARVELATSPLSGVRSNQLSYSPSSEASAYLANGHPQPEIAVARTPGVPDGAGAAMAQRRRRRGG